MPIKLRTVQLIVVLLLTLANGATAQKRSDKQEVESEKKIAPVVELATWRKADVYSVLVNYGSELKAGPLQVPTLKSLDELKKVFKKEVVAKLEKKVDFEKQVLVVFKWAGSGQDRMEPFVSISNPNKILFHTEQGRTKDFVQHLNVYAIRKGVEIRMLGLGRFGLAVPATKTKPVSN